MLLLSKIDVLGTPATLNFFGDNKKRSSFGGICSLIFFSFILWTIYNSSYDLLTRINPATTVGEVNIEEPPIINMSNSAFPVAFIVQTPSTLQATGFTDETIYKIEVQHKRLDRIQQPNGTVVKVWTYTNLTTEPCTKEYFGQYASSFASFTFKGSHCISQNQTGLDQILLQGITSSPVYQALTARIKVCTNGTSNVTCASPTKIKQYLSGSYFSAMYLDTVMDIQNFTNPMTKFRELYYTLMNPLSYKTLDIEVGNVQLTSDAGWVTESKTIETSLQVNKVNELIDLNPSLDNTLILCTFKTSRTQTYYTRTYKKIPTILAEVGGVGNTALAVLLILTTPYLRLKSREALMNRIFKVQAASPKKSEENKNKKKVAKLDEKKKVNHKLQKNRESNRSSRSREDNQKTHGIVTTLTTEAAPFHNYVHPTSPHEPLDSQRIQLMPTSSNPLEKNPTFTFNEPEPTSRRDSSRHSIPAADHNDPENFLRLSQFSRESSIPQEKDITPTRLFARRNQPSMAQGDNLEGKNNILSGDDFENEIEIQLESIKEKVAEEGDDDLEGGGYEARLPSRLNDGITDKENSKQREEEEELEDVDKGDETERDGQENQPVKKEKKEKKERWLIGLRRKLSLSTSELQMWEYLMSFVYKPKSLKEKIEILEHGVKNIDQRLDLSNILKKFCEVDKLIALLLDSDQIELFNNMPNPEIIAPQDRFEWMRRSSFERNLQRQIALTDTPKTKKQILQCYNRLKLKENHDKIDKRLIEIFSEIDT